MLAPSSLAPLLISALSGRASAQEINAQRFTPAVDAREFLVIDDSNVGRDGVGGGLTFNYADDPFVYRFHDGDRSEVDLLGSVATTNLTAFANFRPFRLGVDLPLHVASGGYGVEGFRLFGDLGLDAKYSLWDRRERPLGLGATARVGLPTGAGDAWLGDKNTSLQAQINASMGETVIGAVNLGVRGYLGSAAQLPDVSWGTRLTYGGGLSVPLVDPLWASAELSGEILFGSGAAPGAFPLEALVAVKGNPLGDWVASLGAGAGLTEGIGAPDYRIVAGVSWVPGATTQKVATDAVLTRSSADSDGDGIVDVQDLCPDQSEDYNGKADDDGCPDMGLVPTRLRAADPNGVAIAGARVELLAGPETGRWTTGDGEVVRSLPPGRYTVRAEADDHASAEEIVVIPDVARHEATLHLEPEAPMGTMTLTVLDGDGRPVPARARLLGLDLEIAVGEDGVVQREIPAGTYEVVVSAPEYGVARRTLRVEPDGTASLDVLLQKGRVLVTEDKLVILDRVFFEFDSAAIKPESFAILDEVAAAMVDHAEIQKVEIGGHSDDQGGADYNRTLSQRRAEAVQVYLESRGVSRSRLSARGYGEDRPLQQGTTPEVRATNRRVEFVITRRGETAARR